MNIYPCWLYSYGMYCHHGELYYLVQSYSYIVIYYTWVVMSCYGWFWMAHLHAGCCLLRWICQLQSDWHRRRSPCKLWQTMRWVVGPLSRRAIRNRQRFLRVCYRNLMILCGFTGHWTLDDPGWLLLEVLLSSPMLLQVGSTWALSTYRAKGQGRAQIQVAKVGNRDRATERDLVMFWRQFLDPLL